MVSPKNSIKIHEECKVAPPSSTKFSLPLTFFDLFWLRFHPVERIFFYPLQKHPLFFYDKVIPKLKNSLSQTLRHFPPLAGNIVWLNDSDKPIIQYNPNANDGVTFLIAESDEDFNHFLDNSPQDSIQSRSLIPHLDSSDSQASVMSLQVTLFPNNGFSIGISTHHAVVDGKSSTMFIKAWASLCQTSEESTPFLPPELFPFFDREVIKDPTGSGTSFVDNLVENLSKLFPDDNSNGRCLKILPIQPKLENTVRASFELTRADLEKIKKRVLSKWDTVDGGAESSKPPTLSTFVLTCAYVLVCVAKAIQGIEKEREKFAFSFTVDCRARLDPPIPENYFGNCVWGHIVETHPHDFVKEDGVVIVAKSIYNKTKMLGEKGGAFEGSKSGLSKFQSLLSEGVEIMGIAGSNRFGVYGIDFGWGKPSKVEITSIDRGLTIGLAESKDRSGGVEVGLVLNIHVMNLFTTLFHEGI